MADGVWGQLVAVLSTIGFGVLSAIFPLANAEAYVVASQATALMQPAVGAGAIAVGQTIGKTVLFLGVRSGRAIVKSRHRAPSTRPVGPLRAKLRELTARLLGLIGQKRWGLPVVLLAAVVGIPPLYAVALLAGATTMNPALFAATVLVGRSARFVLIALGANWLLPMHPD